MISLLLTIIVTVIVSDQVLDPHPPVKSTRDAHTIISTAGISKNVLVKQVAKEVEIYVAATKISKVFSVDGLDSVANSRTFFSARRDDCARITARQLSDTCSDQLFEFTGKFWAKGEKASASNIVSGRLPVIGEHQVNFRRLIDFNFEIFVKRLSGVEAHVSPNFSLTNSTRNFDCGDGGTVCLPHQQKSHYKKNNANPRCGDYLTGVVSHSLSGFIHSLRGCVHSLLGAKVFYVSLASFFLAALAGIGGGLVLDNFNRERKWKRLGWCLFLLCLPLGAAARLLSLS